ncbi:tripartite motif-containing protein 3-like [Ptychodera flava]|uniref:tripartite motif-containing protein 3-like n=1 Tax=Ptychodera flava TaxID=63121 RepID=UPI003969BDB4
MDDIEVTDISADNEYTKPKITEIEKEEVSQPKMTSTEGSGMELTTTSTQPEMTGSDGSEMEVAISTQPKMTAEEGSEMETATLTQPKMIGRDGSEMETATSTQPEMTGRDGSEMETATPTQPEMTGMEGHGITTEAVTTATEHQTGKRDSSGIFGKFFKRLTGRKDKTDGSKVMSIGKKELSGSVTAGSKELSSSSGPVSSVMSGGTSTLPGSKEEQSGSYSDGSGKGSDLESMEKMVGGRATPSSAGRWSRRTLKGHQGQKFKRVRGLAFHNDKLLVCDRDNNIVHILNQDYTCEKELGSFSGQLAKPFQPQSIAVSQDNLYFILDASHVQIVVCDQNNKVIRIITLPTDSDPRCIALVKGFVIVTDVKGHRVLKYSQTGQYISEFGRRGNRETQFDWPGFVAVNSKDVIMVSDQGNHCIKCFDTDLNYLYQYGHHGTGDSQLYYPRSIAVDGADNVYVCDYNDRISIWRQNGTWICHLFHREGIYPYYMAVTADGDRIAVDGPTGNEITVFSK